MGLQTPNLDDRRFQDIVDEAKRRIPRYSPQWTDHNVSDPGVTLIELFAWMVEMMLYRVNKVPEKSHTTFLDLMGVRLEPPVAARTELTFWLAAPLPDPATVPAGTEVATVQTASDAAVSFTTNSELVLPPAVLNATLTSSDERTFEDQFWKLGVPGESFLAFQPSPVPGDAFYLGYRSDHSNQIFGLLVNASIEGIGVDPTNPPLAWEAWCTDGWTEAEFDRDEDGKPRDGTGGLNRQGQLYLYLPPNMAERELHGRRAYWLRCRHTTPQPGQPTYSASPRIHMIESSLLGGAVEASHARAYPREPLGRSDGTDGQKFRLEHTPILSRQEGETVEVQGEDGSWVSWVERADFAESHSTDLHFTLDSVSGEICFGPFMREPDGSGRQYGAVPPRGSQIRFTRYRSGGGVVGNVEAGKLTALTTTVPYIDRVSNRRRATGGRDAESLDHARLRAPQMLRTRDRAVTVEDYEVLAIEASSRIARARCLQPRALGASNTPPPGVVQLLLVPNLAPRDGRIAPEELRPPQQAIQEVQRYLDERRMLTTVVQITQPEYRWVSVDARLKATREADLEVVYREALARLYRFLNPITGGADGAGWPFGRDLYISEVYAILQHVPGIEYIEQVRLLLQELNGAQPRIEVPANALVASDEHRIVIV